MKPVDHAIAVRVELVEELTEFQVRDVEGVAQLLQDIVAALHGLLEPSPVTFKPRGRKQASGKPFGHQEASKTMVVVL